MKTTQRFQRWQDFAERMARACWPYNTPDWLPDRQWIEVEIAGFFACLPEEDYALYRNWDNSEPYPVGHPYHRTDRRGHANSPGVMGDLVSEWEDDTLYYQWREYASPLERLWGDIHCEIFGDDDLIREPVVERWSSPVHCCIRAGMDCAYAPSGGVMGFTAGDLRRMYPEGVPDWVKGDGPWETVPITGVIPGVGFTVGETRPNGTFDSLPDDASVWL